MNHRRKLIVALGASAVAAPFASFAQQPGKVWRVGFLGPRTDSLDSGTYGAFRRGMRELGYVEGKNLKIEWRFADGNYTRLPGLAAELVQLNADVIVAVSTEGIRAVQNATNKIPIVGYSSDPIGEGFVKTLARPGGNITGLANMGGDLSPKHLEMLLAMVPKLFLVAVLTNPSNPINAAALKNVQAAALRVSIKVLPVEARTPKDIEKAVDTMIREKAGAVIVPNDAVFNQQRHQLAELALRNRLPSVFRYSVFVEAGGLMSYGVDSLEEFRRAATYVDKIIKGAKPSDLPVEQPTKFELVINRKTAKALGLSIPQSLLISADRVIE